MAVRALPSSDTETQIAAVTARIASLEGQLSTERTRLAVLLVEHAATIAARQAAPRDPWLSAKHAAAHLDIDESRIWKAVGDGSLPSASIGRSRRLRLTDIEHWAATQ